jgi:hypothetical protein
MDVAAMSCILGHIATFLGFSGNPLGQKPAVSSNLIIAVWNLARDLSAKMGSTVFKQNQEASFIWFMFVIATRLSPTSPADSGRRDRISWTRIRGQTGSCHFHGSFVHKSF